MLTNRHSELICEVPAGRFCAGNPFEHFRFYTPRRAKTAGLHWGYFLNGGFRSDVASTRGWKAHCVAARRRGRRRARTSCYRPEPKFSMVISRRPSVAGIRPSAAQLKRRPHDRELPPEFNALQYILGMRPGAAFAPSYETQAHSNGSGCVAPGLKCSPI
jgi:hypothetical protein